MLNKAQLIGNLGQDPELRYTNDQTGVATLSVATNERWKDKQGNPQEHTEWHRIVVWGKQAENCQKYLSKGSKVYVEGKLQTRSWDDKDGVKRYTTEINAHTVRFLDSKSEGQGARPPHPGNQPAQGSVANGNANVQPPPAAVGGPSTPGLDDIPF